jgi:hypothetical protein
MARLKISHYYQPKWEDLLWICKQKSSRGTNSTSVSHCAFHHFLESYHSMWGSLIIPLIPETQHPASETAARLCMYPNRQKMGAAIS